MASAVVSTGEVVAGRYRVEEQLGEGGMGAVYGVTDLETNQPFAMKVLLDASGEHARRFDREVKAMMRIQSDHVVKVFSVGAITESLPFMVMERLDGRTLKTSAPLEEQAVADLFMQACEGLAHAHALGIVHRDIKPSNLFVTNSPTRDLKVLDFGIARATSYEAYEQTASMTLTESVALLGSPMFISPEQLQSPSNVDERADIWSLGVSMYYALTGELPFQGGSLAEILVAVMSKPVPPLAGRCQASPDMIAIVNRCLDRNIDQRYRRVGDLAEDLAAFATVPRALLAPKIKALLANAAPIVAQTPRHLTVPTPDRTLTLTDEPPAPAKSASALPPASASAVPPGRRISPLVVAAFGLGLLITVGAGAAVVLKKRAPVAGSEDAAATSALVASAPPVSASAPSSVSPATASVAEEPDTSLELVADAPIARVIKPNARRVELEDGKAMIDVGDITSDVPIEVELETGGRARGVAHAGDHRVKLVTAKSTGRPRPSGKPPASNNDLHKNPY